MGLSIVLFSRPNLVLNDWMRIKCLQKWTFSIFYKGY